MKNCNRKDLGGIALTLSLLMSPYHAARGQSAIHGTTTQVNETTNDRELSLNFKKYYLEATHKQYCEVKQ